MKSRTLTFLLTMLLCLLSCAGPKEPKDVLIVLPHSRMTQIYNSSVAAAQAEFADSTRYRLHFYVAAEEANVLFDDRNYFADAGPRIKRALNRVVQDKINPSLIIFYGDALSHNAALSDHELLQTTPVLCVGVVYPKYNDILAQKSNFVVMEAEPAIKENLDFIVEMGFPNYVVTELDSLYVDDRIRERILEQIGSDRTHYRPNLHLEDEDRFHTISRRDPRITMMPLSISQPEKNDHHPEIPGAFKFEWAFNTQQNQCSYLHIKDDVFSHCVLGYNVGPYFAMSPEYFNLPLVNAMNYCLGGYMTPFPSMWQQVHPIVDKLLDGVPPKQIPWGKLKKDYWLDWRLVQHMHEYADQFPSKVHFVNLPFSKRSRWAMIMPAVMLTLLVLIIIAYAVILPIVMGSKERKQRLQLLEKAKEAETVNAKVEYILSHIDAYIWHLYPDRSFKFSDSFYRVFHIDKNAPMNAEELLLQVREPGRSQFKKLLFDTSNTENSEVEIIVDMKSRQETHAIRVICINVYDGDSAGHGGLHKIGYFYFNDESFKLNEELRAAYMRSEEIAEKETFLSTIDVDFRKPVDTIIFFSNMLAKHFNELSQAQKTEFGDKVMEANDNLIELLDEIMGDTRQSRSEQIIQLSELKVASLMEEMYVYLQVSLKPEARLELCPGSEESVIKTNRPMFFQVMNTLITNAFDSGTEHVVMGWHENTDNEVVIFIDDADTDISICEKMVNSMGAHISMLKFPGSPTRIDITYPPPITYL